MNTRKIVMSSVIAVAVLVAMLVAVPSALAAYPANSTYFNPEASSGAYCQNDTYVEIRLNTTDPGELGGGMDIYYDPNCVNITAANFSGTPWSQMQGFTDWGNYARISNFDLMGAGATGDVLFATITLHCINSSCNCTSSLNFSGLNGFTNPAPYQTHNGTINCTGAQPINVDIHAEGINGTIFNATNYAVSSGTVTEDSITIRNQTAMGAMVVYCQENAINVTLINSGGAYVLLIGDDLGDNNSWMYAVDKVVPMVDGDDYNLTGGESVHWFNYNLGYNLTVTSAGCCPINVSYYWGWITDTVNASQTKTYNIGYYSDVDIEALDSGTCSFNRWVYDGIVDTVNKSITVNMNGDKTATAYCGAATGATVSVDPQNTTVLPQGQFDVNITLDASGGVFGVQYMLTYDTSILKAESQVSRDFFVNPSIVVINEIDNKKGTVTYAATLTGNNSCEYTAGTIATIQFTAIGEPNATSDLTLSNVKVIDCTKEEVVPNIENGTAHIYSNQRPNIECVNSTHEKNNAAKKFACDALLCVNVTNPQEEMGWNISYIRWSFGDGQYGTSEGGLPCNTSLTGSCCNCKNHSYISWNYNASGSVMPRPDHSGNPHVVYYDPFNASVTVTDDGNPALSHTAFFDVWVFMAGDANGDAKVNILDAVWIGKHFNEQCNGGATCCDYKWSSNQPSGADLNNDCVINILDAVIVGTLWGHTAY